MRRARKTVSTRTRFRVLARSGHKCVYCGRGAPEVRLTIDHVVAVSRGGSNDESNLCAACEQCNAGKADLGGGERRRMYLSEIEARLLAVLKVCDAHVGTVATDARILNAAANLTRKGLATWIPTARAYRAV